MLIICIVKQTMIKSIQDDYMMLMYGAVQVDPNYKRIHNYSSSACMYKNGCSSDGRQSSLVYFLDIGIIHGYVFGS